MIPIMCLVQSRQFDSDKTKQLQQKIEHFAQQAFNDEVQIDWLIVPKGNGFTAAKTSNSIVISVQSNRVLPQDTREALLSELCQLWIQNTDLSAEEVVVSIRDPQQ